MKSSIQHNEEDERLSYFSAPDFNQKVNKSPLLVSTVAMTAVIVVSASFVGCASAPTVRPVRGGYSTVAVPTYYTVKSGDSLSKIAIRYNLDYRDIARMNQVGSDFVIQVGQRLRLTGGATTTSAQPVAMAVEQPLSAKPLASSPSVPQSSSKSVNPVSAPLSSQASAAYGNAWRWPTDNMISQDFEPRKQIKGIRFSGQAGDPVQAAADGAVIYAGNGLPEYGNLILIQHASGYITASAHNQKLLVQEKTRVSAGQQIAEMGSTGTTQVMLEFQVRLNGKPMNPRLVLPKK
jgi:lipoprotein NlpD